MKGYPNTGYCENKHEDWVARIYHTEPGSIRHIVPYQFSTNTWYRGHTDTQYTELAPYQHVIGWHWYGPSAETAYLVGWWKKVYFSVIFAYLGAFSLNMFQVEQCLEKKQHVASQTTNTILIVRFSQLICTIFHFECLTQVECTEHCTCNFLKKNVR